MADPLLVSFVAVSLLLTVTPGADMAYVAGVTLRHGRRRAIVGSLGVLSGLAVHATASALGLSILLAQSAEAFTALKVAGAVYLLYLGGRTLWEARTGSPAMEEAPRTPGEDRRIFLRGLLSNLLNAKVAVFYLAFLPQFIGPGDPVLARSFLLAGIHIAEGLVWLPVYVALVDRLGRAARGGSARAWMERATGAALVAVGVRLLFERAPGRLAA